jgi:ribosomal subunit interface protein
MLINYTGKLSGLNEGQRKKLDVRFAKLGKLLDTGAEQRHAHVIIKAERHLTKAEITVHFYGHEIVGTGSDGDPFSAMNGAAHHLETQVLKLRKKWIDSKRGNGKLGPTVEASVAAAAPAPKAAKAPKARIYRPRVSEAIKPMPVEEAVLSIGKKDNYLLFRDPDGDSVSLLVRRADGNFDLIET